MYVVVIVMQHAKTKLFSQSDICHKSTFKYFYWKIKFFMQIDILLLNYFWEWYIFNMKQIIA